MSRMCTDLYNWSAPEFGYVEVDDSVAICSSIMPQKRIHTLLNMLEAELEISWATLLVVTALSKILPIQTSAMPQAKVPATSWSA